MELLRMLPMGDLYVVKSKRYSEVTGFIFETVKKYNSKYVNKHLLNVKRKFHQSSI